MGKTNSYIALGPQWAQVSSTPYPYFKSYLANGGIHVPAIIKYPNSKQQNDINHNFMSAMDFTPTILDITKIKRPETNDGHTCSFVQPTTGCMLTTYFESSGRCKPSD